MKSHTAETAGHTRLSGSRHVFTARLPDSVVGLSLPARHSPHGQPPGRVVLDAAVALAEAETWLAVIEDWLACGLMPELSPVTEPLAEQLMFNQHVMLSHPVLDVEVHLPLSALRASSTPPPEALAGWVWRPLACELVLDAVPLTLADVQALHAGALLILPASFASAWSARLVPVGGQGGVYGARLYEQRGRLCAAAVGQTAPHPANDQCTVRFSQPVEVTPPHLLGWGPAKPPALDAPLLLSAGAVVLHGSALLKSQPLVAGQLIPVGSGFGLRLDQMLTPTAPPPPEPSAFLQPDISL